MADERFSSTAEALSCGVWMSRGNRRQRVRPNVIEQLVWCDTRDLAATDRGRNQMVRRREQIRRSLLVSVKDSKYLQTAECSLLSRAATVLFLTKSDVLRALL